MHVLLKAKSENGEEAIKNFGRIWRVEALVNGRLLCSSTDMVTGRVCNRWVLEYQDPDFDVEDTT